jgi:hypothetical protein
MKTKQSQIFLGAIVLTLGILSAGPGVRATEPMDGGTNGNTTGEPFEGAGIGLPFQTSENLSLGAVTESSDGEESASELNRKLTNPVSSIWSIANQFNNELNNGQSLTTGISSQYSVSLTGT